PGFVDGDGVVLGGAENLPGWKGTQIYAPIMQKFNLKATAANDVTVMALAEAKYGAGKGVRNLVCFALGTGIGGGIVTDYHLFKGTHGMAGELGHIVVETNGIPCNCGQRGCVERYASATGIVNMARKLCAEAKDNNPTEFVIEVNKNPLAVTSKMVYNYVKNNDPVAVRVNEIACDMLARAIGITLNTLSPDRVVLGGGVMMAGQVIIDTLCRYVPLYCWPAIWERCQLAIAQLGEDAGVLGAGAMAFEEFEVK
ncbi:MAG: ROK family protein, partial [Fibrobacter sp.]|nr:ROK family protein [Fibrobacter sp.]